LPENSGLTLSVSSDTGGVRIETIHRFSTLTSMNADELSPLIVTQRHCVLCAEGMGVE